jgi:Bacteriophage CI repressor helix-turn-helix domain.
MADTTFWTNFNTLVKDQNTTQDAVCSDINISINTLRGWISKNILPRADEAVKIATALHTTVEYLVTGEKPVDKTPELKSAILETLNKF